MADVIPPEEAQMIEQPQPVKQLKEDPVFIQMRERRDVLKGKLMTMEWDVQHGQINPGKKVMFDRLKKEFDELEQKLKV
jgi:hypothetical protein